MSTDNFPHFTAKQPFGNAYIGRCNQVVLSLLVAVYTGRGGEDVS